MRNLETGKHIKLSNGDEYCICRNMLSKNAEYFLLFNLSGKLVNDNTEMLLMKYTYNTEEQEINSVIKKMIKLL